MSRARMSPRLRYWLSFLLGAVLGLVLGWVLYGVRP